MDDAVGIPDLNIQGETDDVIRARPAGVASPAHRSSKTLDRLQGRAGLISSNPPGDRCGGAGPTRTGRIEGTGVEMKSGRRRSSTSMRDAGTRGNLAAIEGVRAATAVVRTGERDR